MADSLAAIKKLVFEEKKITPIQLWNAILDDFQSDENKKIQAMLIDEVPKYGNDIDYVDNLVVEAYDSYLDEIKKYPNTRYHRGPIGGIRYGGTSSISANVGQGMGTMAHLMEEMLMNHLQKVVALHIMQIKMAQQLYLNLLLNCQQKK